MQSLKEEIESTLEPEWGAILGALTGLYALWPALALSASRDGNTGGGEWALVVVLGFIGFCVVAFVLSYGLGSVFCWVESIGARAAISLGMVFVFGWNRGMPPVWALVLVAVFAGLGYWQGARANEDAIDREAFCLSDEKPKEIEVDANFLRRFSKPLWNELPLREWKPLSAIEGEQEGHRFTILDIVHWKYRYILGLQRMTHDRLVTTFVIVAIPGSVRGRRIAREPEGYRASTDGTYLYLAKEDTRARPKEWGHLVELAIKTAESLT